MTPCWLNASATSPVVIPVFRLAARLAGTVNRPGAIPRDRDVRAVAGLSSYVPPAQVIVQFSDRLAPPEVTTTPPASSLS